MVGIRDVARQANVSTATVTRALRGDPKVTPRTRELVESAARELGYVPNAAARALTSGRSRLLGLFVPDIANPFYAELAQGMEDVAAQHGYHCVIASSHLDPAREAQLLSAFRDGTLAGLAMTTVSRDRAMLATLKSATLPLVFVDRRPRGIKAPLIATNNEEMAKAAVDRLLELGHRRIGMLAGPLHFETSAQRIRGFEKALAEAGIEADPDLVREGHVEQHGGYAAMQEILGLRRRPTAVFSFNNLLTVGALQALKEAHVRIPADMSLVSFDDMSLFPFTDPPITAIAQPAREIGSRTAELLVAALADGVRLRADEIVPARLIERSSWGPAPRKTRRAPHS